MEIKGSRLHNRPNNSIWTAEGNNMLKILDYTIFLWQLLLYRHAHSFTHTQGGSSVFLKGSLTQTKEEIKNCDQSPP